MSAPISSIRLRRILQAMWSGAAARIITGSLTLVSLPLTVRYLGAERYGVWATIATTAVWINLLDLGVANTLTNHISHAYARHDRQAAARAFTNALLLSAATVSVAGALFAFVFPKINWAALFNVSASVSAVEVSHTLAVAVAIVLFAIPCALVSKLLAGYQELHRYNFAMCAGAVAGVGGLAVGIVLHVSMPLLFLMSVGCVTFASFAMLLAVVWQKPWLLPRWSLIRFASLRELLNSGSSFFLIQTAAVVVFSSDNLIVSHYLGAAEVTPYSVIWRITAFAALLQSLLFPALWPAYAEAHARGEYRWIRRTFLATMKGIVGLNVVAAVALVFFGRAVIRLWAGPAAVPGRSLVIAMAIWMVVSGFMTMESCLLAALNRTRAQALLSIVAAGVNIALSLLLVRHIGSLGVIAGTILSYLVVLVVPQTLIVRSVWRELRGASERGLGVRPEESREVLVSNY